MSSVISLLVNGVAACFLWLDQLLSAISGEDLILAAVIIFLVSRFLLAPLIGGFSSGSDKAKKSGSKKEDE